MSMDPSFPRTANTDPAVPGAEEEPPLLVLASRSPGRARILQDAGVDFETIVSDVDEEAAVSAAVERLGGSLDAPSMALLLARTKAESVAALEAADGAVVLGCDSVFEFDGASYGKPHTAEVAIERWKAMRGRTGVLHTGHWLVDNRNTEEDDGGTGATLGTVASASVTFDEVPDEEIEAYVATGEPLPCAGAFTIDGRGAAFITGIDGDPHTVVGLSVNTLRQLLASAELSITDLWA